MAAASGAVAAEVPAAAAGPGLHPNAPPRGVNFFTVREVCSRVSVSRAWRSAAQCMPSYRTWQRASHMSLDDLHAHCIAARELLGLRLANEPERIAQILRAFESSLRRDRCESACAPL